MSVHQSVRVLVVLLVGIMFMPAAHAQTIVYVSHADSREIYVMKLNPADGTSAIIEKMPVAGTAMPMAISPDKKFLFISLRSDPFSVSSFSIDPASGKLTLIKTSPLPDNMAYISTDRTGRWL